MVKRRRAGNRKPNTRSRNAVISVKASVSAVIDSDAKTRRKGTRRERKMIEGL